MNIWHAGSFSIPANTFNSLVSTGRYTLTLNQQVAGKNGTLFAWIGVATFDQWILSFNIPGQGNNDKMALINSAGVIESPMSKPIGSIPLTQQIKGFVLGSTSKNLNVNDIIQASLVNTSASAVTTGGTNIIQVYLLEGIQ